jgi:RNA polymerase sigma factor (sigma-70 family)
MTMTRSRFNGAVLHQFERLLRQGTVAGSSEAELLERYVTHRDDAAFEALMTRHGPMVLGVCRQLLQDPNDVDDAFQATFLVLVRKAGSLRRCDLLGNWLYGVAYRVATRARVMASRRTDRVAAFQRHAAGECEPADNRISKDWPDFELKPRLHEEVNRLPEKYRVPIVLCYFEGLTHEEAAARMGCPLGTVKGRLSRARDLLHRRLSRRGLTLSGATLASHLAIRGVDAAVPTSLEHITLTAAQAVARRASLSLTMISGVSRPVASLVRGVLQAMILNQFRAIALPLLFAAGTVAAGVVVAATQLSGGPTDDQTAEQAASQDAAKTRRQIFEKVGRAKRSGNQASQETAKTKVPNSQSPPQSNQGAQGAGTAQGFGGGGGGYGGDRPADAKDRIRLRRRGIAAMMAVVAARETNPKSKDVFKKLEEPISMSFANETPLDDVLKYIKQATTTKTFSGIPIYVDPKGLQEAEKSLTSTVSIDLEGIPLKTTLRLLLKQLDLAYCVRDGVLIISSVQGIAEELQEAQSELEANDPPKGGLQ